MNLVTRRTVSALAVLAAGAAFSGTAFAAGTEASPAPAKSKMAAKPTKVASTFKCPSCGMMMASTKSAAAPVAVVINKHTYYCCAGCASGKAAAAKMTPKKPA